MCPALLARLHHAARYALSVSSHVLRDEHVAGAPPHFVLRHEAGGLITSYCMHTYCCALLLDGFAEAAGFATLGPLLPPGACDAGVPLLSGDPEFEGARSREEMDAAGRADAYNAAVRLGEADAAVMSHVVRGNRSSSLVKNVSSGKWPLREGDALGVLQIARPSDIRGLHLAPSLIRVALACLVSLKHLTPDLAAAAVHTRPGLRNVGWSLPADAVALVELGGVECWGVAADGGLYGPLPALDAVSLFCGLLRLGPYYTGAAARALARPRPEPRAPRVEACDLVLILPPAAAAPRHAAAPAI
jgi:hypothetical protein